MINKIIWVMNRIFCLILSLFLNVIRKDNKLILFGLKPEPYIKDFFFHNTKYLFLYMQKQKQYKTVWLCDDKDMINEFRTRGFRNVYRRHSIKGIWSIIRSKYWFCDITPNQITRFNCSLSKSLIINLWHGAAGLKKVGYDAQENQYKFKKSSIQDKIYNYLRPKTDYYVINSEFEAQCRKSAFNANNEQLLLLGSPRLDVLFHDIENADIFMLKDYNKILEYKQQGKHILCYTPTFRDTGENIAKWLKSDEIAKFLKNNNMILVCKLHPRDNSSLNFKLPDEIYKMSNNSDIYPILKYSDGLITDYSSIYFDYLLLDKPILYFIPDLSEYTRQCRGFYEPYENLTAGIYAKTEDELLKGLTDIINGIDNYKEKRKTLRDRMFVFQDGNNCQRNVEFIRGLEK